MNESVYKQKVVAILVNSKINKGKTKLFEYPELKALFEEGLYIESFNQCRLSRTKVFVTFLLRYNH